MTIFPISDIKDLNMNLLKVAKSPLPQIINAISRGLALTTRERGMNMGLCVMERQGKSFKLIHLAVDADYQNQGYGRELLLHSLDYARFLGADAIYAEAGNANVLMFTFLQQNGFRIIEVTPDYYISNNHPTEVENAIVNRDLLHYKASIGELMAR